MPESPEKRDFSEADGNLRRIVASSATQILPDPAAFGVGSAVLVRGQRARILSVEAHDNCCAFTLGRPGNDPLVLLAPFDRLRPAGAVRWRRSSPRRVYGAVAAAWLEARGLGRIGRAAARAPALRLLAWQLRAVHAIQRGETSRVLLADAVGLGKTVQAGLVHLTLRETPEHDRTLILTPAGLRDQWRDELERLFGLRPGVMDAPRLRRLSATLPSAVNPWAVPGVFIAAIDFIKQPEVLAQVLDVRWTLVVLDEAHALAAHTDRRRAADLTARASEYVLLLTATPHSGDAEAFDHLCAIGSLDGDQPLVVRRDRVDVGPVVPRRLRLIRVRSTPAERRLHAVLRRYLRHVRHDRVMTTEHVQLASWVLMKRAASSVRALRLTLERRRGVLAGMPHEFAQPALPFDGDAGEIQEEDTWMPAAIDLPGLRDRGAELRVLEWLVASAKMLETHDRKLQTAVKFVRRAREPLIVFTEYRDTLEHVAELLPAGSVAVLHGGMRRSERRESLLRFTHGQVRVLLATDTAGEGLNLQHTCRAIVNLDVPWNPSRLEQRIGRVDRLGQRGRVHAVTLASRAADAVLLRRFAARQRLAQNALEWSVPPAIEHDPADAASGAVAVLRAAAVQRPRGSTRPHLPWASVDPATRRRLGLPPGVLLVFRADTPLGSARPARPACFAVMVELAVGRLSGFSVRRLIEACAAVAAPAAARHTHAASQESLKIRRRCLTALRRRLQSSLSGEPSIPELCQPGLFDRRAITAALERRAARERRRDALERVLQSLDCESGSEDLEPARPIAALILR